MLIDFRQFLSIFPHFFGDVFRSFAVFSDFFDAIDVSPIFFDFSDDGFRKISIEALATGKKSKFISGNRRISKGSENKTTKKKLIIKNKKIKTQNSAK
jgi:hypothetical protein